jgi:thiol-disulfide isomerase/thioredoxin
MNRVHGCLFFIIAMSITCYSQKNYFNISGKVTNISGDLKVFLCQVNEKVDSIEAIGGEFVFTGNVDEPTLAVIVLDNLANLEDVTKRRIIYLVKNTNLKLNGTYSDFNKSILTGSNFSDDAEEFQNHLYVLDTIAAQQRRDSIEKAMVSKYITSHTASYTALTHLYLHRGKFKNQELSDLYRKVNPSIKGLKYGRLLQKYITTSSELNIGDFAPEFTLKSLDGKLIDLKSYRGKYVLLDFWGSWCSPCRWENPHLVALYNKYKKNGFEIIGIGLDKKRDKLLKAINDDKIEWFNVHEPNELDSDIAFKYGVWYVPHNFLIDPNGKIVGVGLKDAAVKIGSKPLSEVLKEIYNY